MDFAFYADFQRRSYWSCKPAQKHSNAEQAAARANRQDRRMTYHNFASRLAIPRLTRREEAELVPKSAPKKPRRQNVRRTIATAALTILLCLYAQAASTADTTLDHSPVGARNNAPTLIITTVGLAVVLLRLPRLWRRDFST